jgi:hypothetical protein
LILFYEEWNRLRLQLITFQLILWGQLQHFKTKHLYFCFANGINRKTYFGAF